MVRLLGFVCAALLFASAPARAAGSCDATDQRQGAPSHAKDNKATQPPAGRDGPKKWWIEADSRAELGITDQQSAALEQVYQKTLQQRMELRERTDKAEAILNKLILDGAEEAAVTAQLDKAEAARSEANKARVLVLYRMNKLLTQEQRAKLDAKVRAMRERDGRRGGGPR